MIELFIVSIDRNITVCTANHALKRFLHYLIMREHQSMDFIWVSYIKAMLNVFSRCPSRMVLRWNLNTLIAINGYITEVIPNIFKFVRTEILQRMPGKSSDFAG